MKNSRKKWTEDDLNYLYQRWGEVSIPTIAKNLGRSEVAILLMAGRKGLGPMLDSGEAISFNQLVYAIKGTNSGYSNCWDSWVKRYGLPVYTKKVRKNSFKVVYISDFWKWAKEHRNLVDFSKMEPLILGEEPDWVAEQRKLDFQTNHKRKTTPWTEAEDAKLKYLVGLQSYGYFEIAQMLNRSCGAIQRRLVDLNIKERPVRADSVRSSKWTQEQYDVLTDCIKNGESLLLASEKIGKSEKAIRGKIYTHYLTEEVDKVRRMIGDGRYGDNLPSPTIKQALSLSRCRKECRETLQTLINTLSNRMCVLKGGAQNYETSK